MPGLDLEFDSLNEYLQGVFEGSYRRLIERVDRWTQVAAPLNPTTYPKGNTKQFNRWELPREQYAYLYVAEEDCYAIKHRLLAQVVFMEDAPPPPDDLRDQLQRQYEDIGRRIFCPLRGEPVTVADIRAALRQTSRIGRQEINISFATVPEEGERLELTELVWIKPPYYVYHVRGAFSRLRGMRTKVQTKAYLTDRRQTGDFPTNRESRWEAHPYSPQFSTPAECIRVEAKLLGQVFQFSGAPKLEVDDSIRTHVQSILGAELEPGTFRCPISGQFIEYTDFVQVAEEPEPGRSKYQAAHVLPLATQDGRHTAENTSWMTELGNRVQGEDAIDDIVNSIFLMAVYHKERLGLTWEDVEKRPEESEQVAS